MLDLEKRRFSLAQLQEIAPKLKPKVFHNWVARGIIQFLDEPSATSRRRYSVELAIALKFATEAIDLGVRVADAFKMADQILDQVSDFERRFAPEIDDGLIKYVFAFKDISTKYRRGRMEKLDDGSTSLVAFDAGGVEEDHRRVSRKPLVYLTVEIDILIADVLNATYRMLRAGVIK